MPKKAVPFKLDIAKVKENYAKGKFPYKIPCSSCQKLCGNTSMEIFNTRIKSYGTIDKLYENYVCTDCRKTKQIVPIKDNNDPKSSIMLDANGDVICRESLGRMPDGSLDYWFRHPLYHLPHDERRMVETFDGYVTFVKTNE